jgi:GMP synthase (glutamine-hydrolysing)
MRPFAIVVTGEPVAAARQRRGGFANLIRQALGPSFDSAWLEHDARTSEPFPQPQQLTGIIVTGSPSSVMERLAWMQRAEAFLCSAIEQQVPVLGICFGHQLLAQALGGRVDKNPVGREMGTVALEIVEADPLLDHPARPFCVNMTHVDAVLELPPGARVLARTRRDRHAALRFSEQAWGVQFHPEIDAEVMRDYLSSRRDALVREGFDADALLSGTSDAEPGKAVLQRFVERTLGRR